MGLPPFSHFLQDSENSSLLNDKLSKCAWAQKQISLNSLGWQHSTIFLEWHSGA